MTTKDNQPTQNMEDTPDTLRAVDLPRIVRLDYGGSVNCIDGNYCYNARGDESRWMIHHLIGRFWVTDTELPKVRFMAEAHGWMVATMGEPNAKAHAPQTQPETKP